jgi:hypothetical protein
MTNRVAISQKKRFEVFKRDGFKCMYCGCLPNQKVLEVDHITPVSKGGGNHMENLITACFDCNRGKGARELSDVPQSLADRAQQVKEQEAQIKGYQKVMKARRERLEGEAWECLDALYPGHVVSKFEGDKMQSIRFFIERMGLYEVIAAAEIASSKRLDPARAYKYFCGICWNVMRGQQ